MAAAPRPVGRKSMVALHPVPLFHIHPVCAWKHS